MALSATCPKCGTGFKVSEQQQGKKIRCSRCSTVFAVPKADADEAPAERMVQVVKVTTEPKGPQRAAAVAGSRAPRLRDEDDDIRDDRDDNEFQKPQGRSVLPWVLLGCAGLLLVGLLVGGVITVLVVRGLSSSEPDVADNHDQPLANAPQGGGNGFQPGGNGFPPAGPPPFAAGGPTNVDEALQGLKPEMDFGTQLAACNWLARAPVDPRRQAEVARALETLFNSANDLVIASNAEALKNWATAEQVPALVRALDHKNPFVRKHIIAAVVRLKDPRALPGLAKMLTSFFTRQEGASALIEFGPSAADEVRKYLTHAESDVREEAMRVLRTINKAEKSDELTVALANLRDSNVFARGKGLDWFAGNPPLQDPRRDEAAAEVGRVLVSGNALEKPRAAQALANWATPKEVEVMVRVLRGEKMGPTRGALIEALGKLRDKSAVPVLVEQLGQFFDADKVEKALVAFGSGIEDDVARVFMQGDKKAAIAACKVLGQIGTARSVPALQRVFVLAQQQGLLSRDLAMAAQQAVLSIQSRR